MFEELELEGEGIKPTSHEKIRVLTGGRMTFEQMSGWLEELTLLVRRRTCTAWSPSW